MKWVFGVLGAVVLGACGLWADLDALAQQVAGGQKQGCEVQLPAGFAGPVPQDALAQWLRQQRGCPTDVLAFRRGLQQQGASLSPTMVANRGFHNPKLGSFSLFEVVRGQLRGVDHELGSGQFFFGHFTAADKQQLFLDQNPQQGSLMIELIAWDPQSKVFNFYELIGQQQAAAATEATEPQAAVARWFYRGNSLDIQADIQDLHLERPAGQPAFGQRLRCSGCHLNGGPIMKELNGPHNDWWRAERHLPLGENKPDADLKQIMQSLKDASFLAEQVQSGELSLLRHQALEPQQSWQAQLRPLFCPQEVNFESAAQPLSHPSAVFELPMSSLINPLQLQFMDWKLWSQLPVLSVERTSYQQALRQLQSRFPEIDSHDADHPWLTPVKAWSDEQAVLLLVEQGQLDMAFVWDVLAVDPLRPFYSPGRCGLLKAVPPTRNPQWQSQFRTALAALSQGDGETAEAAQQLLQYLEDPHANHQFHATRAVALLKACQQRLKTPEGVLALLQWLGYQRRAISQSEISANPRGQILEPGFRVIFPSLALAPQQPRLSDNCELVLTP